MTEEPPARPVAGPRVKAWRALVLIATVVGCLLLSLLLPRSPDVLLRGQLDGFASAAAAHDAANRRVMGFLWGRDWEMQTRHDHDRHRFQIRMPGGRATLACETEAMPAAGGGFSIKWTIDAHGRDAGPTARALKSYLDGSAR